MDKDLIGERVILRSNEDEPPVVGTLVTWQKMSGNQEFPVVKQDDGQEVLAFSVLLPYSKELFDLLNSMTPKEGWELAKKMSLLCQVRTRKMFPSD